MKPSLIVLMGSMLSFLFGTLPFGVWIASSFGGKDIRTQGSGNIGATNVTRVIGFWPAGFLTFLLDGLKGILVVIPIHFGWVEIPGITFTPEIFWFFCFCAVVGHCFSPWLKFKGGKGVATTFVAISFLAPWSGLVGALSFGVAFLASRVGAISSLTGLLMALSVHLIFYPLGPYIVSFVAMVLLVIYRHESNLTALLENRQKGF